MVTTEPRLGDDIMSNKERVTRFLSVVLARRPKITEKNEYGLVQLREDLKSAQWPAIHLDHERSLVQKIQRKLLTKGTFISAQ